MKHNSEIMRKFFKFLFFKCFDLKPGYFIIAIFHATKDRNILFHITESLNKIVLFNGMTKIITQTLINRFKVSWFSLFYDLL